MLKASVSRLGWVEVGYRKGGSPRHPHLARLGGYVKNITLVNSVLNHNKVAFEYNEYYGGHPAGWNHFAIPTVAGIYVRNCTGSGNAQVADLVRAAGELGVRASDQLLRLQQGLLERSMMDIQFEDVTVTGDKGWDCNLYLQGSQRNVVPAACPQLHKET